MADGALGRGNVFAGVLNNDAGARMTTRRQLLKWAAPMILTLPVTPSMARSGSDWSEPDDKPTTYTVSLPGGYYGDPNVPTTFYSAGAWQILPTGQVYHLELGPLWPTPMWQYKGQFGAVTFPLGFPVFTLDPVSPIFVVPSS